MESHARWLLTIIVLAGFMDEGLTQNDCQTGVVTRSATRIPQGQSDIQLLRGNLQLLIPAWILNDTGYVHLWQAAVQGSASTNAIDFQIYEPRAGQNGVYDLIYGNAFDTTRDHSQSGNNISVLVDNNFNPPLIPVRPGYVVGVRLRNNTPGADPSFGLQYINSSTAGVDVYYRQVMGIQACSLSTSDPNSSVGVLHGIIPLVSWTFCVNAIDAVDSVFRSYLEDSPLICSGGIAPTRTLLRSTVSTLSPPTTFPISSLSNNKPTIESPLPSQSTPLPPTKTTVDLDTTGDTFTLTPTTQSVLDTTNTPPTDANTMVSPTTIITLAVMIFLFIVMLVLLAVVILMLRNALKERSPDVKIAKTPTVKTKEFVHSSAEHSKEFNQLPTERGDSSYLPGDPRVPGGYPQVPGDPGVPGIPGVAGDQGVPGDCPQVHEVLI